MDSCILATRFFYTKRCTPNVVSEPVHVQVQYVVNTILRLSVLASIIIACARVAVAQHNPEHGVSTALLQSLDADDVTTRNQATNTIVSDHTTGEGELLWTVLNQPSLTIEQHDRLLRIIERRRLERPGVIGIRFSLRGTTIIQSVEESVPAAQFLQPGDVITSVDGMELVGREGQSLLQRVVTAKRAGDVVTLGILRDKENITMDVPLADERDIPGFTGSSLGGLRVQYWKVIRHAIGDAAISVQMAGADDTLPSDMPRDHADRGNQKMYYARGIGSGVDGFYERSVIEVEMEELESLLTVAEDLVSSTQNEILVELMKRHITEWQDKHDRLQTVLIEGGSEKDDRDTGSDIREGIDAGHE